MTKHTITPTDIAVEFECDPGIYRVWQATASNGVRYLQMTRSAFHFEPLPDLPPIKKIVRPTQAILATAKNADQMLSMLRDLPAIAH